MNHRNNSRLKSRPWIQAAALLLTYSTLSTGTLGADAAKPATAAEAAASTNPAWDEIEKMGAPPRPPEAWRSNRPSQAEIDRFKTTESERLVKAAEKAREFLTKYPKDTNAEEARAKEYEWLETAAQLGNTNVLTRLETLDQTKLQDTNLSDEERFHVQWSAANRRAMSKLSLGMPAALKELEKGGRELLKQYPKRPEVYQMLLDVASESEPEKGKLLAKELAQNSNTPEQVKAAAQDLLDKLDRVGKPLDLKFTAVDGRPVDLSKLKGKVVLIDFWATWCGPCVRELPNVRAAYEKLHPRGFEIIGISFDREKPKLLSFVQQEKMTWPQYFDGKQWDNDYGKKFGIQSIPAMWLVDRKGNLRDLEARDGLADKVEKLLAEKP